MSKKNVIARPKVNLKAAIEAKTKLMAEKILPSSANAKSEGGSTSAKASEKAAPKAKGLSVNRGPSGMGIMAFQDMTLARNDEPKFRRTDEELATIWCTEFPNSRAVKNGRITAEMVRAVRGEFNRGTNDHGTLGAPVMPAKRSWVIGKDGKRTQSAVAVIAKKAVKGKAAPIVAAEPKKKLTIKRVARKVSTDAATTSAVA